MCGIVGIFDTRGRRDIDRAALARMNEAQLHRGPDAGGVHVEPGVGLGSACAQLLEAPRHQLRPGQPQPRSPGRQHLVECGIERGELLQGG